MPAPDLLRRARRLHRLALVGCILAFAACDGAETDGPPPGHVVAGGVDLTRLLAPPTDAERTAVQADWDARRPEARGVEVVGPVAMGDGSDLYAVSHETVGGPGAAGRHVGLVRVPGGAQFAPVLIVHHGGDGGIAAVGQDPNTAVSAMAQAFPALFATSVQIFPATRGEAVQTAPFALLGGTRVAGGDPSVWDYDVDDAMALLSAVLESPAFADAIDGSRIGALGFGRGAETALLQTARDPRIDAVIAYYPPADFFNPAAQNLARILLGPDGDARRMALALPGARVLLDGVLAPLQGPGGSVSASADYDAARRALVRRSASAFAGRLRNVQLHHHHRDGVVPVAFSEALAAHGGAVEGLFEFDAYGEPAAGPADLTPAVHSPLAMPASIPRTEEFFGRLVASQAPGARSADRAF